MMYKWFALLLVVLAGTAHSTYGADPICSNGLQNAAKEVCCPRTCVKCGGPACNNRPGGPSKCCSNNIVASHRACTDHNAPCITKKSSSTGPPAKTGPPVSAPPPPALPGSAVQRHTEVYIYPGLRTLYDREEDYNVTFDGIVMYQKVLDLHWSWIKPYLDKGKQVEMVLEFIDGTTNLQQIAEGKYDAQLQAFAVDAKKDGRFFKMRVMHEMNGEWYSWSTGRGGSNTVDAFKAAFRHVVLLFKQAGINAQYQLAYNSKNAGSTKATSQDLYPGDDVVDEVCVSAYNQAGIDADHPTMKSFEDVLSPWYNSMVFSNKPLCIAEMGTTNLDGTKAQWITDAWNVMTYKFTKLQTISWFITTKSNRTWDFYDQAQEDAFTNGMNAFRAATRA